MHERQRRGQARVGEVREHPLDLRGREHALVDERRGRQAHDVEGAARRLVESQGGDGVLDALADDIEGALEAQPAVVRGIKGGAHEELLEDRRDGGGRGADGHQARRHRAPAEHGLAFLADDALDQGPQFGPRRVGRGQEHQTGAVAAGGRQGKRRDLTQERVGHLDEDAGAVAGVGIGARRAAMLEVDEQVEGLAHDGVGAVTLDVGHETHAAGVVFVALAVEPRRCRCPLARPRLVAEVLHAVSIHPSCPRGAN